MSLKSACLVIRTSLLGGVLLLSHLLNPGTIFSQDSSLTPGNSAWRPLLEGDITAQWTGFKKQSFPEKGWRMENGCLKHAKNAGGGDIVTRDLFTDFELEWQWGIGAGGNSGIKYFITDERSEAIGHEYQMLDDYDQLRKASPNKGSTGSFYDVLPPVDPPLRPSGETNYSRILVQGSRAQHWLNGRKVLDYELDSPLVKNAIAKSKFKNVAGFESKLKGRILLQDHGGEVWFRNMRIRELPSKP